MNKNTRLLLVLCLFALAMLGVAYAFVPMYRVFCQAFGIPVPQVAVEPLLAAPKGNGKVSSRTVTVRFMGQSNGTMPVQLSPVTYTMRVRLGEATLTGYRAVNATSKSFDGVAVHTLYAMGGLDGANINKYVDLTQCFCFQSQHYPAHNTVTLPLSFTVTPDLPEGIHTITFSYTLFPEQSAPKNPA